MVRFLNRGEKALYRKSIRLLVVGAGVLLLLAAGIVTVSATPPSQEGEPPNLGAEYVGTGFCMMCHTQDEAWHASGHAQMVRPASEETILGDLADTAAVTITWPDGSERPLTAEDITYVLGGRYMQRYVSVITRADGTTGYYVLPVQWNIPQTEDQPGVWTPFHAEDWQDPARDWRVACAGCHTTGLDGATAAEETGFAFVEEWDKGQVELNIGCEACHGPGGVHFGNQGTLVKSPDAQICGQCHIQGQDPSGEHGYPVGYQPGLALDESLFVPAPPTDESVWWPDGHARVYNQYGEWLESTHAQTRAMGDVCVRCHATTSTPGDQAVADATDGITCAACHDVHSSGLRLPATAAQVVGAPAEQTETEASTGFSWGDETTTEGQAGAESAGADQPAAADTSPAVSVDETTLSYTLCVTCHNSRTPDGAPLVMGGGLHHPTQEMF
jgi:predicted CXXCH cytochrome family protein